MATEEPAAATLRDRLGAQLRPGGARSTAIAIVVGGLSISAAFSKRPGIGVALAIVAIGLILWARRAGLAGLGLSLRVSWPRTFTVGVASGTAIQALSIFAIEPLAKALTGRGPDLAAFDAIRGSVTRTVVWSVLVWVGAFFEEVVFRGFLVSELRAALGDRFGALARNLLFSSAVFGVGHFYQGAGGVLTTALTGLLLALVFVRSRFSLWPAVIAHGTINTIAVLLIYSSLDQVLVTR